MPRTQNPDARRRYAKGAVALWVTLVAGFVDIVGALTVYNIFSAHMTGTSVRMGEHLVQHDWNGFLIAGTVLGAFFAGSLTGRILIEAASRAHFRSVAAITLSIEAIFLACAMAVAPPALQQSFRPVALPLTLLAAAMGFQTATLTRVGPLTVHTTFVTGMLNKLSQLVSHWLFRSYDVLRATGDSALDLRRARSHASRQASFIFSIWLFYVMGAVGGTYAALRHGSKSLIIPFCMLLAAVAVDLAQPLSIEEEREQSER